MKKNSFWKALLFCFAISLIIEGGYVFIKNIYLKAHDIYGSKELKYNIEDNSIILNDDGYIEKLFVDYEVIDDVDFEVNYISSDYYGNDKEYIIEERFDNEINRQVINVKKKVKNFRIVSEELNKVKIVKLISYNKVRFNYYVLGYIFCALLLIVVLYNIFKYGISKDDIYKYFMFFAFIIGLLFIFLQPSSTYYSWDDQIHFTNTYEMFKTVSRWKVGEFSMVDVSPVGLRSIGGIEEHEIQNEYLNSNNYSEFTSTSSRFITYSRVFYILPSIGFNVARIIGLPFSICFKAGKVMILLCYVLIMGYAIKISKIGKRLLSVVGLIPTSMFLASQYSYDSAVISGVTLAMVMLINWFVDKKEKVTFNSMLIFILAILYASFVKGIYIPIILLFLMIPKDRFSNVKVSRSVKILSVILMLLVMYTFVMPTVGNSAVAGDVRGGDTSVSAQIAMILSHPLGYFKVLYNCMIGNFIDFLVGVNLIINYAYLGVIRGNLFYLYFIVLLFVAFTDMYFYKLDKKYKISILVICLGVSVLIWTALYVSYTPVGALDIAGVQPRYFLPLTFPMLLLLHSDKIKHNFSDKVYDTIVFAIPVFVLMVSLYKFFLISFCL